MIAAFAALVATGCGGGHKVVYLGPRPDPLKSPAIKAVNRWVDDIEARAWGKACGLTSHRLVAHLGGNGQCLRLLELAVHSTNGMQEVFASEGHAHLTVSVPATLSVDSVREADAFVSRFASPTPEATRAPVRY